MKALGQNLVFYAKYWDEMETLYVDEIYSILEQGDTDTIERIRQKVKQVGDAADIEVKQFLNLLQSDLLSLITNKPRYLPVVAAQRSWSWQFGIWLSSKGQAARRLQLGVSIDRENDRGVVRPWIWIGGGRAAGQALRALLRTGRFHAVYKSVLLRDIQIPDFDLDRPAELEPLRSETIRKFRPVFTKLDAVWHLASRTFGNTQQPQG